MLAVSPDDVNAPSDPWLLEGIPSHIPIHRVRAIGCWWRFVPGLGGLPWRAIEALRRKGNDLIRQRRYDLIYFSTTVFQVQILGAYWRNRFGVPYVLDYQDPWVTDYYKLNPHVPRPGGVVKNTIAGGLDRMLEPITLRHCSGITAVSPGYPANLARRYKWFAKKTLVQPFPGAKRDFERLTSVRSADAISSGKDGSTRIEWLYLGRGGGDIATSARAIFVALKRYAPGELLARLRLRLVGTSYAPAGRARKSIEPIANDIGLSGIVDEQPERIPYSEGLALLSKADALIIPASDDPNYTASKIYPYLLSGKPLLVVCRNGGPLDLFLQRVGGAVCVGYGADDSVNQIADRIGLRWLKDRKFEERTPLNQVAFQAFMDVNCADELGEFLKKCLAVQEPVPRASRWNSGRDA